VLERGGNGIHGTRDGGDFGGHGFGDFAVLRVDNAKDVLRGERVDGS
jgi:hypothetical protein